MYSVDLYFFDSELADFSLPQTVGGLLTLLSLWMQASTVLLCKQKLKEGETIFTVE